MTVRPILNIIEINCDNLIFFIVIIILIGLIHTLLFIRSFIKIPRVWTPIDVLSLKKSYSIHAESIDWV